MKRKDKWADFSETEQRVLTNSALLEDVEEAVSQAEKGVEMLIGQWENVCKLNDYLDSGQWLSDFKADERGEIRRELPRGVLSEDGLYNVIERLQEVLGAMAQLVDHVDIPA